MELEDASTSDDTFGWKHLLYRMFDDDGNLLYVGRTGSLSGRFAAHARTQPWWGDVARSVIETLPNFEALCAAEKAAILAEKPRYNTHHNVARPEVVRVARYDGWDYGHDATAALEYFNRRIGDEYRTASGR